MLKQKPERITYAQEKLLKLIEERKLRCWCLDNGIIHSAAYRLALGEQLPTYKIMSSMCHLIAPIEWLFYKNEPLPYAPELLPKWDTKKQSKFVKEHRFDYKAIAEKYGLTELSAYNIFVAYRASPTPALIKAACKDVNPSEFFTDGEIEIQKDYIPERGDIVSVDGNIFLVITDSEGNEKRKIFSGCSIRSSNSETTDGIALKGTSTGGTVNPFSIQSFSILRTKPRTLIGKADEGVAEKVLDAVRKMFV